MQITIKTIKGELFQVDTAEDDTIEKLKEAVGEVKSVTVDKLIFQGKILENAKTLKDYSIQDKATIIGMFKKAKAPAPAAASPAPAPAPAPSSSTPATETAPATAPASTGAQASGGATTGMTVGPELQATIDQMCEMGFPREDVQRALRAAFNNPDRAMQYLLEGIPEGLGAAPPTAANPPAAQGAAPPAQPAAQPAAAAGGAAPAAVSAESLQAALGGAQQQPGNPLLQIPGLAQIMQLVRANPAALQPLLQEIGRQQPELLQHIQQNQEAFLELLNTPPEELEAMGAGAGAGAGVPQQVQIQVTDEERAAITRLMDLGFPERAVLEAYFACDKDENLAANFLFENFNEED